MFDPGTSSLALTRTVTRLCYDKRVGSHRTGNPRSIIGKFHAKVEDP
jgi:hypothetical protein